MDESSQSGRKPCNLGNNFTLRDLNDLQLLHGHIVTSTLHNAALPVNVLPTEIFVAIVRLATAALCLDGMTWITSALGVCRHWREIILSTPSLWTNIDLTKNPHFVQLCLARSDAINISVQLPIQLFDNWRATNDLLSAFSLVLPHRRRISHLDLCLTFIAWNSDLNQSLLSTLEAELPSLVSLSLTTRPGFRLRLQGSHLSSLRSLSLTNVTLESLAALLDLLESCTTLESFTYEHWKSPQPQESAHDRVVSLPKMSRFTLSGLQADIIQVTTHLSLPRTARLHLELFDLSTDVSPDNDFPVLATAFPPDPSRLPVLADVRHVMVWSERFKLNIYADTQHHTFWEARASKASNCKAPPDADGEGAPVVPSLCAVYRLSGSESDDYVLANAARELPAFFPPAVETVVLRGATDIVATAGWAHMLAAFPRIEHLELIAVRSDVKTLPPALALTPTGPPCPRLRTLVLRYEPNEEDGGRQMLDELYEVLKMRDEAGCRLESLSIQVEPLGDDALFMPSEVFRRLPPDFEDIERNLESIVGSLEVMLLIDGD